MREFLNVVFAAASITAIVINVEVIIARYKENAAERMKYGAPLSFWHSIRGRGFWKEEDGWHNE